MTGEVSIIRKSERYPNKNVKLVWYSPDNTKIQNATWFFNSVVDGKEIKFHVPVSLDSMDEIVSVFESYKFNYSLIKLHCLEGLQENEVNESDEE